MDLLSGLEFSRKRTTNPLVTREVYTFWLRSPLYADRLPLSSVTVVQAGCTVLQVGQALPVPEYVLG